MWARHFRLTRLLALPTFYACKLPSIRFQMNSTKRRWVFDLPTIGFAGAKTRASILSSFISMITNIIVLKIP